MCVDVDFSKLITFQGYSELRWIMHASYEANQLFAWIPYYELPEFMSFAKHFLDGVDNIDVNLQEDGVCIDLNELTGESYEEELKAVFNPEDCMGRLEE